MMNVPALLAACSTLRMHWRYPVRTACISAAIAALQGYRVLVGWAARSLAAVGTAHALADTGTQQPAPKSSMQLKEVHGLSE
jgi:hypothetical protein